MPASAPAAASTSTSTNTSQPDVPRIADASLTPGVLAATAAITVAAALACSIGPLLTIRDRHLRDALTAGGRGQTGGSLAGRIRSALVACHGARLRSARQRRTVVPKPRQPAARRSWFPPVERAHLRPVAAELAVSQRRGADDVLPDVNARAVGDTRRLVRRSSPLLRVPPEAVAHHRLAGGFASVAGPGTGGVLQPRCRRRLRRDGHPAQSDDTGPRPEIVGIVGDVRQKQLDEAPKPELYTTFASMPMPFLSIVVRTERDATSHSVAP